MKFLTENENVAFNMFQSAAPRMRTNFCIFGENKLWKNVCIRGSFCPLILFQYIFFVVTSVLLVYLYVCMSFCLGIWNVVVLYVRK